MMLPWFTLPWFTLPWIARSSHEEIVSLIAAELAELKGERKILLDRLASIGLGGPLYAAGAVAPEESPAETSQEPEGASDPELELVDRLMRLRHRPAKLADALTRKAYRDWSKRSVGPKVAWVPQMDRVNAALDEAERAASSF